MNLDLLSSVVIKLFTGSSQPRKVADDSDAAKIRLPDVSNGAGANSLDGASLRRAALENTSLLLLEPEREFMLFYAQRMMTRLMRQRMRSMQLEERALEFLDSFKSNNRYDSNVAFFAAGFSLAFRFTAFSRIFMILADCALWSETLKSPRRSCVSFSLVCEPNISVASVRIFSAPAFSKIEVPCGCCFRALLRRRQRNAWLQISGH